MQMGKVSNLKGSYNSYQMWLTMKYILSLLLIVLLRDMVVTGFMLKDYWNRMHATNEYLERLGLYRPAFDDYGNYDSVLL